MARRQRDDRSDDVIAAIDIGTNAVRLEIARVSSDGGLETLHTERDPVRPGEGLFKTGVMSREVQDRLISALRRYAALCRRYRARVRAVATSAVREARNREEIVRRVRREAKISIEVLPGREEARLICLGVLKGKPPLSRSLCVDIGGGSTEVAFAFGEKPSQLFSVNLGAVRLTELFELKGKVSKKQLRLVRDFCREAVAEVLPERIRWAPETALGSSGTIGAVVAFAQREGFGHATRREVTRAVERLADMDTARRRKRFDARRADIIVAGAVILEAVLKHLALERVTAVDRGLREGVLNDLLKRRKSEPEDDDQALIETALAIGRRFGFGDAHAEHVAMLSLALFDQLQAVHGLPPEARRWLNVAALLHDVGHAVSYQRHHKHSQYVIQNADLPGITERERVLCGLIARFHRRSAPSVEHEAFEPLDDAEVRTVRRCATLLRVADALDRSHHQPVQALKANVRGGVVRLSLKSRTSIDLELWDAAHELELFRDVFRKRLVFRAVR
jgi:exopolyphosphatase/guanosine-5'-triphosphate,3'-diphosphate pyrophosphatase